MKKTFAWILVLALLLGLGACGEEEKSLGDKAKKPDINTEQSEDAKSPQPVETEPQEPTDTLETILFTVTYPQDDQWIYDPERVTDREDRGYVYLERLDDEENTITSVSISVSIEDAYYFRENLYNAGFDQKKYVEGEYDRFDIGGVETVKFEDTSWGQLDYYGRVEGAGMTVSVECRKIDENTRPILDRLLEGLTIRVTDTGNVDYPWYWEGKPYEAQNHSAMTGTVTLSSQWIPVKEAIVTHETFDHDIAISGNKGYLLLDGSLREYDFDGSTLTYVRNIETPQSYASVDVLKDGTLVLAGFGSDLVGFKDGQQVFCYDDLSYVALAKDGSWGVSYFTGPDCEKVTFSGGVMMKTPISFPEVTLINYVGVDDQYIYVAGNSAETDKHTGFVYDTAGNLVKTLQGEDGGLGSLTYLSKTDGGFIAMDGNMREIVLWNTDGQFAGSLEDSDLFGTNYPWFCAADLQNDGSIIAIMTEKRADKSAMEAVVYRFSGF